MDVGGGVLEMTSKIFDGLFPALRPFILLAFLLQGPAYSQDICEAIIGGSVIAGDGKFLGKLTNQYDSESVLNEYGSHGSQYSSDSIWNQYGSYGGEYSSFSPFNRHSSTPPVIVKRGKAIAYLSTNKSLGRTVNPFVVKSCDF